ncbi:MAG: serine/threonine protein kinase [Pleurocapsa sp. CRU_1_2]|nr:serine/threonine protein kinase [Pleurocapsa sp. CRU_1_2]
MSDYLDLTSYGYQIEAELGRNREGGRITWKAIEIKTQKTVVVKQFCFAQANSSWSGYKAYTQEIALLQKLSHPNIPQYLNSIETDNGFCLVQEYITAVPCSSFRLLTLDEVKQIAVKMLDILIYLQQQTPPILHRDLSTENILLDESLNVYLIDFGFASLGSKEVAASSVFRGTPGFIAPEQIVQPIMASDIYSLGVSLVCMLAHKDITEVHTFTSADDPYQLNLKQLLPDTDRQFLGWVEKMTNAKVSQRFSDAQTAKNALLKIELPVVASKDLATLTPGETYKPKILGGVAISVATTFATWAIGFTTSQVELRITTIAIAIIATIAIAVAQLGAATIVSLDTQTKTQGIALGVIMPSILVAVSGLIWGMDSAVAISTAIAIAEVLLLSYFWAQLPSKMGNLAQGGCWLSAIAIGITLGLNLSNY